VPAHLYSFSFALNPGWSRMFAPQAEILAYLERTAHEHGVEPLIRYGAGVERAEWDEPAQRWRIDTPAGSLTARALITAAGPLSSPARPDVPGLETFAGTVFHSAEWDHDHDLRGKRVAVFGTGASSAQFIPHVQREAAHVDVFQRTPGWVFPRLDFPHPPALARALRRFPLLQRAVRYFVFYLAESLVFGLVYDQRGLTMNERIARWHLRRQVADPELRAKLEPDYRIGCKRIIFANDYFPALAQPNVTLITDPLREIVPEGIVTADGRLREADTLILGTGFRAFRTPRTTASSAATAARWARCGTRPSRRPTAARSSRAFPTTSCSSARTPGWATTR
jgi:cation diffusion facilitator CzcD-associated flavoprotein CzcO